MKQLHLMLTLILVATMLLSACASAQPTSAPPEAQAAQASSPTAVTVEQKAAPAAPTTILPENAVTAVPATPKETAQPDTDLKDGGTVNLLMWSSPDNFIPYYNLTNYARFIADLVWSRLLKYDDKLNIVPALAERYEVTPDGKSYTFYLRKDVYWTDGKPLTTADVEFTLKLLMAPGFKGTRFGNVQPILGAQDYHDGKATDVPGIKVIDPHTIQLITEKPFAPFLEMVGTVIWILPKHAMADTDPAEMDKHEFAQKPTVGTGPLKFVQYVTDQYVELERNPTYFLGKPHIEKVIVKIMKPDVALAQFAKGELDATTYVADMNPADLENLQSMTNVRVITMSNGQFQQMNINHDKEIFKDKRVRQALVYAIDREAIGKQLLKGQAMVANSPIPPFSPYFNEESLIYKYDPEKAKTLLQEAGWNFDQEVVLTFPTGNLVRERSAPIIQQYLQGVGMKVELQSMDFTSMVKKQDAGELDLWLSGLFSGVFDPDWFASYHSSQMAPAGWNGSRWNNPEADRLMEEGRTTVGFENRKPIYDKLQMVFADDVPVVNLYYPLTIHVVSNRLKNAQPVPAGIEWNIQDWYLSDAE